MTLYHEGSDCDAVAALRAVPASFVLAPNAHAPAAARALLARHTTAVPPSVVADAALVMTEVVSNAVIHGAPHITMTLTVDHDPPQVAVAVHDCGVTVPAVPTVAPDPRQSSGRGLLIMAAMADRWGIEASDPLPGKTVWFAIR